MLGRFRIIIFPLLVVALLFRAGNAWAWPLKKSSTIFIPNTSHAPEELRPALDDLEEGRLESALAGLGMFLKGKQGHEDGYSLAEFCLAEAARAMGLKQLATEYYAELARSSMDPQISIYSLQALETITRDAVFDEKTIVEELVYEMEFGSIPPELGNFVQYYQALMALRSGYPRWAAGHFAKIEQRDDYFYRAMILKALWAIKGDQVAESRRLLEAVVGAPGIGSHVLDEARKALARVLYEQGDFEESYRVYREIDAPDLSLADLILEEAWTSFRKEDYHKAIGLLVAFSAPSFEHLFKPDQYILKALIYMQFCHYRAAQDTLLAFQMRYGSILKLVKHREDISQDPQARQILENTASVKKIDTYLHNLTEESSLIDSLLLLPEEIKEDVLRIYRLKKVRAERIRKRLWKKEVDELKRVLFNAEEQINLLAYEAGMDRYKKVKRMYAKSKLGGKEELVGEVPIFSRKTYYLFDGEYWNDELDDYTFFIEDYCQTPERWAKN